VTVNNAGLPGFGPTLDAKEEDIDKMLDVNIKGTIFMAQAAVPLIPPGGSVINVSSSSSKRGEHLIPIYGATKAAIDSLTYSWASEVRSTPAHRGNLS
jgi:NAD(P)-dependent dehydrogenase (short-subunit alcohol dehydrogenase family)